ncbi:MAG: hypothetical protein LE168_05340 [Endomicrobium sp.]|nr:hypothetical protein [Endomicrobium sp.]
MKKMTLVFFLLAVFAVVSFADAREDDKHVVITYRYTRDFRYYPRALDCYWDYGYDDHFRYYPYGRCGTYYCAHVLNYWGYEHFRRKFEAALTEIELLEKRKAESEAARRQVSRVKVIEAIFYKQFTTDTSPISIAELTVQNKSDYSVTAVFFRGKIVTPQTEKVIIDDTFKYDMLEELPTGEKKTYNIPLNDFGQWSKVQPPDLVKFEVTVVGIETSGGAVLVTAFSEEDGQRLSKLKNKYLY